MKNLKIPPVFFDWVNYLCTALNIRSIPTFIELLIGSMLTQTGFVTDAQMAVDTKRHWGSYYKWIQQGTWSYLALAKKLLVLIIETFGLKELFIIFDDTYVPRSSKKAPDTKYHHQHGCKANRPKYIFGQCWLTLAVALGNGCAVPVVSRLISTTSNTGKLKAANVILRVMRSILCEIKTTRLVDSWFMRKTLILPTLKLGLNVIGQVRSDTALFDIPEPPKAKQRGRPRIYGDKYTRERILDLPAEQISLFIYSKQQQINYRHIIAKARFLKGRVVSAVFCQFEDKDGKLTKPRMILSTDPTLQPQTILEHYAKRWTIEPMFNQLKNSWGMNTVWQQSRQVLSRWVQIVTISYAIPQMLVHLGDDDVKSLMLHTPWRRKHPVTAGRIRAGLIRFFGHFHVRLWWNPKSRKFEPPNEQHLKKEHSKLPKAS